MEAEFFGLHYYLSHDSHSMDAVTRNKCERETIAVFYEVSKQLNIYVDLETFAYSEGGVKELWKAIGKNQVQISLIISIMAIIFSRYPVTDHDLNNLEKESKQLEIEKTRLEIQKLKNKAEPSDNPIEKNAEQIAQALQCVGKIAVRRSNYYKLLIQYPKVNSVGYSAHALDSLPSPEAVVPRSDFSRFVLSSDKLPVEVDDDALIEVFGPVLTRGNYHWRGSYNSDVISFAMSDVEFKSQIVSKKVHFQNGSQLRCVLNIHRRYDEVGEISVTGYSVSIVLEHAESGLAFLETPQGRTYRDAKNLRKSQGDMFPSE